MEKLFRKATWAGLWRRMLASSLWRRGLLCVCILLGVIILLAVVYFYLLPGYSYRRLTNSIISEGSVVSAVADRNGEERELNEMQTLAVISWLADYRSDNAGISHASEWEGWTLDLTLENGREIRLFIEPSAIVFDGVLDDYRIKLDYNDIYNLINELYRS